MCHDVPANLFAFNNMNSLREHRIEVKIYIIIFLLLCLKHKNPTSISHLCCWTIPLERCTEKWNDRASKSLLMATTDFPLTILITESITFAFYYLVFPFFVCFFSLVFWIYNANYFDDFIIFEMFTDQFMFSMANRGLGEFM